jgi:hypothetical protein
LRKRAQEESNEKQLRKHFENQRVLEDLEKQYEKKTGSPYYIITSPSTLLDRGGVFMSSSINLGVMYPERRFIRNIKFHE